MIDQPKYYVCGTPKDLRPYGPKGAWICFPCMIADSEREEEAKRQFAAQLDAAGPAAMIDGSDVGPYPLTGGKQ